MIHDPRSSTPGLGLLMWVKDAYGDRAPEIWQGLAPHIVTVAPGWNEAYGLFLDGEVDMALAYTTSPAYHLIAEDDDSKAAAMFEEGHYMQVEVAAATATSDQPELARRFLAFMLTDGFQGVIPTTNWMYPAHTPAAGLPEGYATLAVPEKPLLFSPEEARGEARRGAGGMAGGAQPIAAPVGPAVRWGGGLALALVAALTLGTVAALVSRAEPGRGLGPAEWAALRFTLEQALISAALSCLARGAGGAGAGAAALPRARGAGGAPRRAVPAAGHRRGLRHRRRSGAAPGSSAAGSRRWAGRGSTSTGSAAWCWRMSSSTWRWWRGWCCRAGSPSRPSSSAWRRSSASRPRDVFRRIEAPMLRDVLPGAFVLVFLLCMTSFAVALTLGGGPRATTLELAIYQAVRFDFDLGRAAWLALIQFALCGAVTLAGAAPLGQRRLRRRAARAACGGGTRAARGLRALDARVLAALALFLGLPLAAVLAQRGRRGRRGPAGGGLAGGAAQPRRGARLGGAGAGARARRSPPSSTRGGRAAAGGGSRRPG